MVELINILKIHQDLSGWVQAAGALLALTATYFSAFVPQWNRQRQLKASGKRLIQHCAEALESYHRTSENYLPSSLNIEMAILSLKVVSDEIDRFPVFDLTDQGPKSTARYMLATTVMLKSVMLVLRDQSSKISGPEGNAEQRDNIRDFIFDQLKFMNSLMSGEDLKRPDWSLSS